MLDLQKLKRICQGLDLNQRVTVGYSGGVDSHVLLHALYQLVLEGLPLQLQALHINHHLNPSADQWVLHCQAICDALKIPLLTLDVHVQKTKGESIEALAREARYGAVTKALPANSYFLTAHHQDDQAETVLLQLLRGAGLKGLSAMPFGKAHQHIYIIRPLLDFSRDDILAYAKSHRLQWIEDSSNHNTQFQRNYLRQAIFPLLKQTWPSCTETLARSAEHCAEAADLIESLAEQDFARCVIDEAQLSISALQLLSVPRIKQVIRYWLHRRGFELPSTTKLDHIITDVLAAKADAQPLVTLRGVEIRRHRDALTAMKPLSSFNAGQRFSWDFSQPLVLPDNLGTLTAESTREQGLNLSMIKGAVEIRFRQGGETCHLPHRSGTYCLKKLFQEWNVPVWQRDRTPLIYYQDQLICVVGFCVCAGFAATVDQGGIVVNVIL